jgi:hypothetical protein
MMFLKSGVGVIVERPLRTHAHHRRRRRHHAPSGEAALTKSLFGQIIGVGYVTHEIKEPHDIAINLIWLKDRLAGARSLNRS